MSPPHPQPEHPDGFRTDFGAILDAAGKRGSRFMCGSGSTSTSSDHTKFAPLPSTQVSARDNPPINAPDPTPPCRY